MHGTYFIQHPKQTLAWNTYVAVFNRQFWMTVVTVFFVSTVTLYTLFLLVDKEFTIGFGTSLAINFLAFFALSMPTYPKRVPGRILFLSG